MGIMLGALAIIGILGSPDLAGVQARRIDPVVDRIPYRDGSGTSGAGGRGVLATRMLVAQ